MMKLKKIKIDAVDLIEHINKCYIKQVGVIHFLDARRYNLIVKSTFIPLNFRPTNELNIK